MTIIEGMLPDWLNDDEVVIVPAPKPPQTPGICTIPEATGIRQRLTPDELQMTKSWEKAHGRTMTDEEINCAVEEFRATIGEM